uniref:NlpC/P60 family protein n=2 Tax=Photobacterium sp. J15 TaxID=265901 RepID=UPI000A4A7E1F|nr:NlpC/P60 family protein [Photobacterium sp. J15]
MRNKNKLTSKHGLIGLLCFSMLVLSGCVSNSHNEAYKTMSAGGGDEKTSVSTGAFGDVYASWKGTPYRLGGSSKQGIDCSAFVQVGYSDVFYFMLPRTTAEQAKLGQWIPLSEAREGDLVFFKTGRKVRHVGIYLGNASFLHASTSRGVMISRLDNPYWRSAFWQVRRVRT